TAVAVEEAAAQYEILEPTPGRGEPQRAAPTSLALCEHLLRGERGVALDIGLVFVKRAHGVVQQVAGEAAMRAMKAQGFMNCARKFRSVAAVQAALKIGIPAGMTDPGAEIKCAPGHLVDRDRRRVLLPIPERGVKGAAQLLVGINGKNPFVGGLFGGEIFLVGVVGPGAS